MQTTSEKIYQEIEGVFIKNKDAQKGFDKAAENAKNPQLKAYFRRKSDDRLEFNRELTRELKTVPDNFGSSATGSMHRAWMDVKALFSADNDESMLEESIRGDKAAVNEYEEILESKDLPVGLRSILTNQMQKIQKDINQNRRLEDLS